MNLNYVTSIKLSDSERENIEILQDSICKINENILSTKWSFDIHDDVKSLVRDFNFNRKHELLNAEKVNSSIDIFEIYKNHHRGIKAEYKFHAYSQTYSVAYKEFNLDFSELYKYHFTTFDYQKLEKYISTLCFLIFENMKNYNPATTSYSYSLLADKNNPYIKYPTDSLLHRNISTDDIKSNSAIKRLLDEGIINLFHTDKIFFTSRIVRLLQTWISAKKDVKTIVNGLFLERAEEISKEIKPKTENTHQIKRHISWCVFHHNNFCSLLNQHCHSSVNCIFYRGARQEHGVALR